MDVGYSRSVQRIVQFISTVAKKILLLICVLQALRIPYCRSTWMSCM